MADNFQKIPTLAQLALKYGTITEDQHTQLNRFIFRDKENTEPDHGALLLQQKMATSYQIGLLKLIQEYHIIRHRGEEFGKIAIKKGFATHGDIRRALDVQKKEFKASRLKKLIGDILVEDGVITAGQKQEILKEQTLFLKKSTTLIAENNDATLDLSDYEQGFLKIKALDEEFAAAVVEKKLASEHQVNQAKTIQEKAFEEKQPLLVLGEIMVSLTFITPEQKDIILVEQGRIETRAAKNKKPILALIPDPDGMSLWIEIDRKNGPAPLLSQIKSRLTQEKITKGVFPDPLIQCCLDHELPRFALARNDQCAELGDARNLKTDFHTNLTDRGEKHKGDLLVTQDTQWKPGVRMDVYGQVRTGRSDLDFTIRCGSGTRLSRDKSRIIASKTGIPALSVERFVYVHPIIHVLEDADLRYGPLEAFANLTISGTITGAYPVTAGNVTAREIRGGIITALGDIRTDVGITDARIQAQGDIHARYLHNCRIETFGTVYVKNEIFDSDIRCSGMVDSPDCRIISSRIHAKKGVIIAGAGSAKTASCTITAGREDHILTLTTSYMEKMKIVSTALEDLKSERREEKNRAKNAFQKMVDLKIFHDRAKQKKRQLVVEFKKNKDDLDEKQLKNILKLIGNCERRMEQSIARLKDLNKTKKTHDGSIKRMETKIQALAPKTAREKLELERSLFACLEWARSSVHSPLIEIRGKAFQGTVLGGVYSNLSIDTHIENFSAREIIPQENQAPFMEIRSESSKASVG